MDKDHLKRIVCEAVDGRLDDMIKLAEDVRRTPELAYREFKSSELVAERFRDLGLDYRDELAVTGLKAKIKGKAERPTVAVVGELDAVPCPVSPIADPKTGYAHVCGHNIQLAVMYGVGAGLIDSGVMKELGGSVVLFAVPAEEYGDIEYMMRLKEENKIQYFSGKSELIRIGEFDDIDMSIFTHARFNTPKRRVELGGTLLGLMGKLVRFKGFSVAVAQGPEFGVNALNAATLALMAIHAQRETFRDQDSVRINSIITRGGKLVNDVPGDVRMEMHVRAKSLGALMKVNKKVDRALKAGAMAVGAEVEITDIPPQLPTLPDKGMDEIYRKNISQLIGEENVLEGKPGSAGCDTGDVTQLMPVLRICFGGFKGLDHAPDFDVTDPKMVYSISTKSIAMTIIDLLYGEAALAKKTIAEFKPKMTKKEYLDLMNQF